VAGIGQFLAQFYYGPLTVLHIWITQLAPILEGPRAAEEFAQRANWILWIGTMPVMRALGPFMGPHDAAQYMAICVPLALVGAILGGRKIGQAGSLPGNVNRPALTLPRCCAWLPVVLMVVFLALTFSRQSWVAALFTVPVMLILGASYRPFSVRLGWIALVGLVCLWVLLAALPTTMIPSRFFSIFNLAERSNAERLETWRKGVDAVEEFPILGTGVGNFFTAIGAGPGAYTHNAYLDVWAETGPLGLIGFLLLLVWAWVTAARVFVEAREPRLRGFGLAALGTLGWLTALFIFDDMLYSARSGPAIWLMLGLLVAARRMLLEPGGVRR
jgi:O-antigen ligase